MSALSFLRTFMGAKCYYVPGICEIGLCMGGIC